MIIVLLLLAGSVHAHIRQQQGGGEGGESDVALQHGRPPERALGLLQRRSRIGKPRTGVCAHQVDSTAKCEDAGRTGAIYLKYNFENRP